MVLFEMMTLRRPFDDKNPLQLSDLSMEGESPTLPPEAEKQFGGGLISLWKRCLNVKPDQRPTVGECKEALAKLL